LENVIADAKDSSSKRFAEYSSLAELPFPERERETTSQPIAENASAIGEPRNPLAPNIAIFDILIP
jgi:hypothetical protein